MDENEKHDQRRVRAHKRAGKSKSVVFVVPRPVRGSYDVRGNRLGHVGTGVCPGQRGPPALACQASGLGGSSSSPSSSAVLHSVSSCARSPCPSSHASSSGSSSASSRPSLSRSFSLWSRAKSGENPRRKCRLRCTFPSSRTSASRQERSRPPTASMPRNSTCMNASPSFAMLQHPARRRRSPPSSSTGHAFQTSCLSRRSCARRGSKTRSRKSSFGTIIQNTSDTKCAYCCSSCSNAYHLQLIAGSVGLEKHRLSKIKDPDTQCTLQHALPGSVSCLCAGRHALLFYTSKW